MRLSMPNDVFPLCNSPNTPSSHDVDDQFGTHRPMSWVDVGGEFIAAAVARLPMCRVRRGPIQWV
jgi:hypothetical protein